MRHCRLTSTLWRPQPRLILPMDTPVPHFPSGDPSPLPQFPCGALSPRVPPFSPVRLLSPVARPHSPPFPHPSPTDPLLNLLIFTQPHPTHFCLCSPQSTFLAPPNSAAPPGKLAASSPIVSPAPGPSSSLIVGPHEHTQIWGGIARRDWPFPRFACQILAECCRRSYHKRS